MKWLNKLGIFTSPQIKEAARQAIIEYRRSFAAAQVNRLTSNWLTTTLSADAAARKDLSALRARCRDLRENNDYAKKFLTMLRANVLGECGIHLRNKARDPDRVQGGKLISGPLDLFANKAVENAWWEWSKKENCTVTKKLTWNDVQNIALETIATDGECLIRKVRGFNNPFKFALQLIESDHLDLDKNEELGNGREIRMGVELDEWKQPVAYWLFKKHPNDNFWGTTQIGQRHFRVDASEIIHPYIIYRIGQTRGIPWMATAMTRLNMLGGYEESELVAARASAQKLGFFEQEGDVQYQGEEDADGNKYMDMQPGTFEVLPQGLKLAEYDPQHPNSQFGIFIKSCLRGIAAGLGNVSYNTLANDMESVNFASGKLGLDEERQGWRMIQAWFIDHVCGEIFPEWLESALATQMVPLPMARFDKFNAPEWRGRRWEYVNPQQEVAAIGERLRMRLTSVSRELAKMGEDRDELFQEIADDKAAMEALGIETDDVFPTPEAELIQQQPEPAPAA